MVSSMIMSGASLNPRFVSNRKCGRIVAKHLNRSTDVVGMALPVQNINHSAFRSMFEKEKLSGNNFNEWFARLKLVLRVEKKMHVIEQPLPPAPEPVAEPNVVDQWTALYDAHTEIACLMLGKEGKPVADYVLKMKGYVEKLERLGYVLPQDIIVGLILNGLTKDFVGFVRNYNMHNMGKTIGEIHAMLIEYEKGLPKKAETPQGKDKKDYISKPKNPKPAAMERPAKDDACHHCKEVGYWKRNCLVYLAELLKKKKQVGSASSSDNCHYAPTITRGVVSVSCLVDNGFDQCFTDYGISISKNSFHYFNAIVRNGIYEIDMHDLVPNMTKKPFPHSNERAKDLLGIIHTDVCGPLRHVSRQGASYFITFTDDYSRYGYVYLLKHKHEVFETFKVFKNEVENQLGKTIKTIRSDRGGEYISQEFKDYLKANRIVQQLTPPYTPQHNGVSERRNHTLLDMVRSMMNLTTLPLSFWDYALESATHILNMVPTKKVDKTPYELWYGKVPNLSYLKVWGCEALMKRDMPKKLKQRSVKCIFIGYL
ncbi:retrotransposon protein, putative, ty1-copia subclass [Tanacetum coccineum]